MNLSANAVHKTVWEALSRIDVDCNLGIGERGHMAHIFGKFNVELRDGEDVVVLIGTETHVHVDWDLIVRAEREDLVGWDSIRFYSAEKSLFAIWPSPKEFRFPAAVISALTALQTTLAQHAKNH